MGDKYDDDRKNPPIAQCAQVSIEFDGKTLLMRGKKLHTYHAVSGKGDGAGDFPTDPALQHKADVGPIPDGMY